MTKAQLRSLTLEFLDDLTGLYFNSTFMDPALNLAQEEVQKHLLFAGQLYWPKQVQALTVQNQSQYVWPSDLLIIDRLELITSGVVPNQIVQEITPITLNQMNRFSQMSGNPTNYVLLKDRFMLNPIPDVPNLTLNLYYEYKIADLTGDSQIPDIPEIYHKLLPAYAARMGKVKDDSNMDNINMLIAPFEKEMDELAQERQHQQPRMVIETDCSYGTGY